MAVLHVDLNAVSENIREYRSSGIVIPVLKDNAYGLGATAVLRKLKADGISLFACSKPEEALALSGEDADILLLSCTHEEEMLKALADANVIIPVESLEQAKFLNSLAKPIRVHIAVDTGFGRFGFLPAEVDDIKALFALENIRVGGIYSHFRSTDSAPEQFLVFQSVLENLKEYPVGIRHIAATLNAKNPAFALDAVRIGTGYTGVLNGQKKVFMLTGSVATVRNLPKGSKIGYTSAVLKKDTKVAIIDVGTGDGAFVYRSCGPRTWLASRKLTVSFGEQTPSVIGLPGLTHTAIDVTDVDIHPGDEVIVSQTPVLVSPNVPKKYIGYVN